MPLRPLYGHERVRGRLAAALAGGRLPQAVLFEGPRGVGKQRLALWLGQLLLCEAPGQEPCGHCHSCRLSLGLTHPDLHWFVPVETEKKGGDAGKQVEIVEEALGEELARRREQPLYEPVSGLAIHGIASVRLLLRRLALRPAMGRRKVFVVGDAERLVPQQANPEAANALLKALEEPPAGTFVLLTAADPQALLPTIVSRVVRVRVPRLADTVVTSFAHNELKPLPGEGVLHGRITAAWGCPGRLLAEEGERDRTGAASAQAFHEAASRQGGAPYAVALRQQPFQARGGFTEMLDALLERLRTEARTGADTGRLVNAIARVLDARAAAQGNVNPQLLAAVLATELREAG